MKNTNFLLIMLLIVGIVLGFTYESSDTDSDDKTTTENTTTASEENTEPFDKMMQVLTHKRCVNCHPAGDRPHQGEDSHVHNFGVQRGEDNHGIAALRCEACHHEENNDYSGVPGAPEWSLAPLAMQWEGLNRVEIAKSMLDPKINGGRNLEEIAAVKEWAESGAVIPKE